MRNILKKIHIIDFSAGPLRRYSEDNRVAILLISSSRNKGDKDSRELIYYLSSQTDTRSGRDCIRPRIPANGMNVIVLGRENQQIKTQKQGNVQCL